MSNLNSYFGEKYLELLNANIGADGTHAWPQRAYCPNGNLAFNFTKLHELFKVPGEFEVELVEGSIVKISHTLTESSIGKCLLKKSKSEIIVADAASPVNGICISPAQTSEQPRLRLDFLHDSEVVSVPSFDMTDREMIAGLVLCAASEGVSKRIENGTLQ